MSIEISLDIAESFAHTDKTKQLLNSNGSDDDDDDESLYLVSSYCVARTKFIKTACGSELGLKRCESF